jgi:hypothetical protein
MRVSEKLAYVSGAREAVFFGDAVLRKTRHWGFAQYGHIAQRHLSAQRDRAPADLRSKVAMVLVAKELQKRDVFVCTLSLIANIAVLQKKSTTFFGRAEVC